MEDLARIVGDFVIWRKEAAPRERNAEAQMKRSRNKRKKPVQDKRREMAKEKKRPLVVGDGFRQDMRNEWQTLSSFLHKPL